MADVMTFDDVLIDYFFSKSLRPATEWSYRKVVKSFISFAGNEVAPEEVDKKLVLHWRRKVIIEDGLTKITWNNKLTHMRAIFNHAITQGHISQRENPFNGTVVRPDVKRKKTLNDAQIKKIYLLMEAREAEERTGRVGACKNALRPAWFWMTVVDILRRTGMRQNQLLHIRLCDVNFEHNWISLRPEGAKNHREHRVPITTHLRPRLERLYDQSVGRGAKMADQLFNISRFDGRRKETSENMDHPPLRAFFRRLSNECGFVVSPHRFRHTIATNLMSLPDRNLKMAQDLLGHSTPAVTLQYVESDIEKVRFVLEQLDAS
ncbi:site-specific integrase [Erwinia amylovora]|uniref:Tyrosine recombinase xerC n=1 Tax=Erwinia piriflorinigrans CFBP 5888 TaxID=1161919 RepID=V5Z3Y5_9GAMM|nr:MULTISPECIES: site-specific integrase [Erwinia]UDJ86303.1 site-specific integrase [Erwinia amylovora]UDJ97763.1 site-specific integrase [Erwinia amylovora]UDK90178.1 site-specific integrase [Erwinia amylovora]UDK93569.1 site-specific integrase [Erwinia amylovora]UOD74405.1 site-specific integrase [Erwinia amylovora]